MKRNCPSVNASIRWNACRHTRGATSGSRPSSMKTNAVAASRSGIQSIELAERRAAVYFADRGD